MGIGEEVVTTVVLGPKTSLRLLKLLLVIHERPGTKFK